MDNSVSLEITPNILQKTFEKDGAVLLEIDISVPRVAEGAPKSRKKINEYYGEAAARLLKYAQNVLLRRAGRAYSNSLTGGAFVPCRLEARYEVVRNSGNVLAVCRDIIEKSAGEEAVAVRHVDNWDTSSGTPVFPVLSRKRRKALLKEIESQAENRAGAGESFYGGIRGGVRRYFNAGNCALGEKGLAVYYPLYSLAPFNAGFPKFEVTGAFQFE